VHCHRNLVISRRRLSGRAWILCLPGAVEMRTFMKIALLMNLWSCSTYDDGRIYFCDASGSQQNSVFFNRRLNSFVISDTFETGSFKCRKGFKFCYSNSDVSIFIPENPISDIEVKTVKDWGYEIWRYDAKSGHLHLTIKNAFRISHFVTCDRI
jgi:hypothetical protein